MSKIQLAVVLEGGLVQAIVSNDPAFFKDIQVTVIDYDTDGADSEDGSSPVEQVDGSFADAFVNGWDVTEALITLPVL